MFDDELTMVEESFRGLGRARAGVTERGGRADERSLTEVLTATERLRRAADALELSVLGQVVRWGEERGPDGIYRQVRLREGEVAEFAEEAVAMATHSSTWAAGERCDLAARAVTDLLPIADLVAEGRIPTRALGIVAKETKRASAEAVAAVLTHLLAPLRGKPGSVRIGELEERALRKAIRRILARVEPELLAEKARRNRREQTDVSFAEGPVGTAQMFATLPSEMAVALKEAIEVAAKLRREVDPTLTAGASRAYGLADLALRGVEVRASIRLGIPIITSAASRLTFAPYEGGECLETPPSHLDQRGTTTVGQDLHGPTAREGRFVTGEGADAVDVVPEEWAGDAVTSQVPASLGPGGQECWISGCEIPGVGFIPADVVAALTSNLETKVSRALVDARTGTLVETSNPRYVVTEGMREFVYARDATCRMWGCNRAIDQGGSQTNGDLDHAREWPQGESCPANLSGLCRHHHRLKHTPGWTHRLHEDGRTEWISPAGVATGTFPSLWVHTDDEGSPPTEGANDSKPRYVCDEDEERHAFYESLKPECLVGVGGPQEYPVDPSF
ncbi:HNH endonuclease signature motif containing protein [Janibacter limosus]|uniref:HNH endonuclease signature motif containing protein n=1 Tax=Janibacter limosus TaxID=53458 RepID=UPI00082D6271|nr:HNH endonuclease signature motif containing protein [Janibacter limosus]